MNDVPAVRIIRFEPRYGPETKAFILSVLAEFGCPYHPEWDADLDKIAEIYKGRSRFWLALDGDAVVGTAAMLWSCGAVFELKRMYLSPDYRGQGIGRLLLMEAVNFAKTHGARQIRLDTMPRMKAAIKLYERSGFVKTAENGERIDYVLHLL